MSRTRHRLPENLNPQGSVCFPVFVPDDPQWIREFIRQVRTLTFDRHWERDEDYSALIVRDVWREVTYKPLIDAVELNDGCGDGNNLSTCFRMDTSTEAFTFYPNDPFTDEPGIQIAVPLQWRRWENTDVENSPIWQGVEDILSFLTGYYPNDCILVPSNPITSPILNWTGFLSAVTNFPFPYVRVDMEGLGQFEIELVNVPFGCSVWIIPDVDITSWQSILEVILEVIDFDGDLPTGWIITEVDRDLSIPPEVAATQTQEIEFTQPGAHSITVVYVPRLDDEIPFFFPFGGVREMEACGQIKVIGTQTDSVIDKTNAGLEAHRREGAIGVSTIDDICNGVICAAIEIMQASVAGLNSGVKVTVDGGKVVVDDGSGSATATTAIAQERLNGSANQAYAGLLEFIQDFEDFYGLFPLSEANTVTFLTSKWLVDETDVTTAVSNYYAHRDGMNVQPAPPGTDLIEDYFCEGISKGTTATHIIDELVNDQILLLSMVNSLLTDQYSKWQSDGAGNPDGDYLGFDCYRRPTFEFDIPGTQIAEATPTQHFITLGLYNGISETRNIKITVSGKFTAPTGEEFDILHWKDDEGVINQQQWATFGLAQNNGAFEINNKPPIQLPYSSSGDYSWIAEVPANNYTTFAWRVFNFTGTWQETVTGTMHVKIEDQGQAI